MTDASVGADEEDPIATDRGPGATGHSNKHSEEQLNSQNSKSNVRQHKKLIVKMLKKRSVFRTAPVNTLQFNNNANVNNSKERANNHAR